jgi:tubulin monoglycylase TTLL3/8
MSRFLEHSAIDLLWTARREKSDLMDPAKNQALIVNRFCRAPFTSKEGICSALKDFHWYYEDGINFPRCYNVWNPEELNDFIENFRLTACIGLLRWLVEQFGKQLIDSKVGTEGRVPSTCFQFAYSRVRELLDSCLHNDIDMEETDEDEKIWQHDWDVFLTHHYLVTHEQATIKIIQRSVPLETLLPSVKVILEEIKPHWPQYVLDGSLNIWIVKPANKCRGRGIQLMNNIKQISQLVNPPLITKSKYVVQKYIERPLIIHNTKFDIRQWFLLTGVQPLQIWCYKECYLRFSSQKYNLLNYHESVHLTNYAIQKKYTNESSRDSRLPSENMWDCLTFQSYLRQIGKADLWTDQIYPGMQKAIIGTMLACQDSMDSTKNTNTFELYGADFMIDEEFQPWLIEINASPDLAPSTSVTARMCPQAIEDTIKGEDLNKKKNQFQPHDNSQEKRTHSLDPFPCGFYRKLLAYLFDTLTMFIVVSG